MNKYVIGSVCNGKKLETTSIPAVLKVWGPYGVWKIKPISALLKDDLHFSLLFFSVSILWYFNRLNADENPP